MPHQRIKVGNHYFEVDRDSRGRIVQMRMWHCRSCPDHDWMAAYLLLAAMVG